MLLFCIWKLNITILLTSTILLIYTTTRDVNVKISDVLKTKGSHENHDHSLNSETKTFPIDDGNTLEDEDDAQQSDLDENEDENISLESLPKPTRGRRGRKQGDSLKKLLTFLLDSLMEKDNKNLFRAPITEDFAPGNFIV